MRRSSIIKETKVKLQNKNGVTLIALVITIIVLLILAGITLNLALDENGIIRKAIGVSKTYKEVEPNELAKLGDFENNLSNILSGNYHEETAQSYTVVYHVDTDKEYNKEFYTGEDCLPKDGEMDLTKEGYSFVGWKRNNEANGDIEKEVVMQDEDIVLYAVFKKDITLSYNGNGPEEDLKGTVEADIKPAYYNNGNITYPTFTIKENAYSQTGGTFKFWGDVANATTGRNAGSTINLENDTTLYAIWKIQLFPNNLTFTHIDPLIGAAHGETPGTVTVNQNTMSRTNCTGSRCNVWLQAYYDLTNYHKISVEYTLQSYIATNPSDVDIYINNEKHTTSRGTPGTFTDTVDISNAKGNTRIIFAIIFWNFSINKIWIE